MRSLFIILGIVAAALSLILSVTPLSKIAFLPAAVALIFGFIAFYMSKEKKMPKKSVQLIFLLTAISLILTTYKSIFQTVEVGNLDELELKEEASMKDSKEILEDLDLDEIDLDLDTTELDFLENDKPREPEELVDQ